MKLIMAAWLFFCLLFASVSPSQIEAVRGLLNRVAPRLNDIFVFELVESSEDFFELENQVDGSIKVVANSGVSLSSGVYHYIRFVLNTSFTWSDPQIIIPDGPLPLLPYGRAFMKANSKYGYYANVCTGSYSSVWWSWERWEREIDWMALHGVNMPLVFNGAEAVWVETMKELGGEYNDGDFDDFFTGPAFLAWQHMGNIRGWGGPLSKSWIDSQANLTQAILNRQRQFGMTPVLPAFAGHVPEAVTHLFPQGNFTRAERWNGFGDDYCCVKQVEVTDPIFRTIGAAFLRAQTRLFGTDHLYNCDTYNEMNPASGDLQYLRHASKSVYEAMKEADPESKWVIQGWLFFNAANFWTLERIEAYLSGVNQDDLIVLDLFSDHTPLWEKTKGYFGSQYIWNTLHNFGGNLGLSGSLSSIVQTALDALKYPGRLVGMGITMEGIHQNEVVYELALDMRWLAKQSVQFLHSGNVKEYIDDWLMQFVRQRYSNMAPKSLEKAWTLLAESVYDNNDKTTQSVTKSLVEIRPSLDMMHGGFMPTTIHYDPAILDMSWKLMLDAVKEQENLSSLASFRYDLVDVTRQALSNRMIELHGAIQRAYNSGMSQLLSKLSHKVKQLIADMDSILVSDEHFLLGNWINDATSWATNAEESKLYEFNAINQITLWGPNGEINDYASKQWAGLVGEYYATRWNLFFDALIDAVNEGERFNQTAFDEACLQFEQSWQVHHFEFADETEGDSIQISRELFATYAKEHLDDESKMR